ncbi:MAG: hypothetical protein FJ000_07405, partial [Actinobacteria bacterium]|nr:hypothetical protein [Actinomycetota bacterium]
MVSALGCTIVSPASAGLPTADGRWHWQNPLPHGNQMADLCFVDAHHGWAVGAGGTILATDDGGASWVSQRSGTTRGLRVVCFVDRLHGWAAGEFETVLATSDGGRTWRRQHVAVLREGVNYVGKLTAMSFPDALHGWICGSENTLMSTVDGGRTWRTVHFDVGRGGFPSYLAGAKLVDFVDAKHGWIHAWRVARGGAEDATLARTTDGGVSWQPVTVPGRWQIRTLDFVDKDNGWAANDGQVFATSDGGRSWTLQWSSADHPEELWASFSDITFLDPRRG